MQRSGPTYTLAQYTITHSLVKTHSENVRLRKFLATATVYGKISNACRIEGLGTRLINKIVCSCTDPRSFCLVGGAREREK